MSVVVTFLLLAIAVLALQENVTQSDGMYQVTPIATNEYNVPPDQWPGIPDTFNLDFEVFHQHPVSIVNVWPALVYSALKAAELGFVGRVKKPWIWRDQNFEIIVEPDSPSSNLTGAHVVWGLHELAHFIDSGRNYFEVDATIDDIGTYRGRLSLKGRAVQGQNVGVGNNFTDSDGPSSDQSVHVSVGNMTVLENTTSVDISLQARQVHAIVRPFRGHPVRDIPTFLLFIWAAVVIAPCNLKRPVQQHWGATDAIHGLRLQHQIQGWMLDWTLDYGGLLVALNSMFTFLFQNMRPTFREVQAIMYLGTRPPRNTRLCPAVALFNTTFMDDEGRRDFGTVQVA